MNETFLKFSSPFIKATKETFSTMVYTELNLHSPKIKTDSVSRGDITALIGISGVYQDDGKQTDFRGLLALSFPEAVYLKLASRMLGEDYHEYGPDISDVGAECANIILGRAKSSLIDMGIKLGLTTPSTIRGKNHEINYLKGSIVIETTASSDAGDFFLDLSYLDIKLK
jgi:chemotaxis protein CheX